MKLDQLAAGRPLKLDQGSRIIQLAGCWNHAAGSAERLGSRNHAAGSGSRMLAGTVKQDHQAGSWMPKAGSGSWNQAAGSDCRNYATGTAGRLGRWIIQLAENSAAWEAGSSDSPETGRIIRPAGSSDSPEAGTMKQDYPAG